MSSIEKALLGITKQKPQKKNEDRQVYLLRLAVAASDKLSDDEWDSLEATDGAQEWVNAAVESDNGKKPISDFPDLESSADSEEDDEGDEETTAPSKSTGKKAAGEKAVQTSSPAKKSSKKTDTSEAAPSSAKAKTKTAPPAEGKKSGKVSMRRALKQIVIKKPKLGVDDLIEQLVKKGYDQPSRLTVTTIRADTRDTIKVLNEANLANIEL